MKHPHRFCAASLLALALYAPPVPAADFIRGDVNGDGVVSLSDAGRLAGYQFRDLGPPDCLASGDVDASGALDLGDVVQLVTYLFTNGEPPAAPFPDPGPEPAWMIPLGCAAVGGSPIEDPASRVGIVGATVSGGSERRGVVSLVFSNSRPLNGGSFRIQDLAGVIESSGWGDASNVQNPTKSFAFKNAVLRGSRVHVGFLTSLTTPQVDDVPIPPGEEVPVFAFGVCIKEGTPPGEFPLVFEAAEFIDDDSGRAIHPVTAAGTIVVLEQIGDTDPCSARLPDPDLSAEFRLGEASGRPGSEVVMPFSIKVNRASNHFGLSIDFDEEVLTGLRIEPVFRRSDGQDYSTQAFKIDNLNSSPGNAGLDEGYLTGVVVIDKAGMPQNNLPADVETLVLNLHFQIKDQAEYGSTRVRFRDFGGLSRFGTNFIYAGNSLSSIGFGNSFVVVDGRINVVSDIIIFVRGDSNGDREVDLSDAVSTLAYLFQSGEALPCRKAADANDDGALDVSDPITVLGALFLGEGRIAPPYPEAGSDPTPDALGCLSPLSF